MCIFGHLIVMQLQNSGISNLLLLNLVCASVRESRLVRDRAFNFSKVCELGSNHRTENRLCSTWMRTTGVAEGVEQEDCHAAGQTKQRRSRLLITNLIANRVANQSNM